MSAIGRKQAYKPDERASDSSCAELPDRNPPPGFLAEAKFRHSGLQSASRSAASSVVSPVTSTLVVNWTGCFGRGFGNASGRYRMEPATEALRASATKTVLPDGVQ